MKIFAHIYQTKDKRLFAVQNIKLNKLTKRGGVQSYWIAEQVFQAADGSFNMMQVVTNHGTGGISGVDTATREQYGQYHRGETKKDVLKKIL